MPQFADEVVGLLIRFLVVQFGGEEGAPCPAEHTFTSGPAHWDEP